MAKSSTLISGGYKVNDSTAIIAFLNGAITGLSGANVFTWPDANGQLVWVGVTQTGTGT